MKRSVSEPNFPDRSSVCYADYGFDRALPLQSDRMIQTLTDLNCGLKQTIKIQARVIEYHKTDKALLCEQVEELKHLVANLQGKHTTIIHEEPGMTSKLSGSSSCRLLRGALASLSDQRLRDLDAEILRIKAGANAEIRRMADSNGEMEHKLEIAEREKQHFEALAAEWESALSIKENEVRDLMAELIGIRTKSDKMKILFDRMMKQSIACRPHVAMLHEILAIAQSVAEKHQHKVLYDALAELMERISWDDEQEA
jgi:hypothetical protein